MSESPDSRTDPYGDIPINAPQSAMQSKKFIITLCMQIECSKSFKSQILVYVDYFKGIITSNCTELKDFGALDQHVNVATMSKLLSPVNSHSNPSWWRSFYTSPILKLLATD